MEHAARIYIDRETGEKRKEVTYGQSELVFLYKHPLGKRLRPILTQLNWFSHISRLSKLGWKRKSYIRKFVEAYKVNIDDIEHPLETYKTFDAFFTRRLKPGARRIDQTPNCLTAPADARYRVYKINQDLSFNLKGQTTTLDAVLGGQNKDKDFRGGWLVIARLAPDDYHRFHFPINGVASSFTSVSGPLESVHTIALESGAPSFLNKRAIISLSGAACDLLLQVNVGALTVGTILHTYTPGAVSRGDECGYFRLGGSTVLLIWGANGPKPNQDLIENTSNGFETLIRMGSAIAFADGRTDD